MSGILIILTVYNYMYFIIIIIFCYTLLHVLNLK